MILSDKEITFERDFINSPSRKHTTLAGAISILKGVFFCYYHQSIRLKYIILIVDKVPSLYKKIRISYNSLEYDRLPR